MTKLETRQVPVTLAELRTQVSHLFLAARSEQVHI